MLKYLPYVLLFAVATAIIYGLGALAFYAAGSGPF